MNKLRSVTLLGTFAAAGVAMAIGVGVSVSSTPATLPEVLAFPKPAVSDRAGSREPEAVEVAGPAAAANGERPVEGRPAPRVAAGNTSSRPEAAPLATVHLGTPAFAHQTPPVHGSSPVAPHPSYGQQFSLDAIQETVKQAMEELKRGEQAAAQHSQPVSQPSAPLLAPAETAAATVSAPAGDARIEDEGDGLLTIHIQNEDIRRVLELLGAHGNINILASPRVQGTVSATLSKVQIDNALDAILRANGYQARQDGDFVFVGTSADFVALEQSFDRIATRIYRPNYITASELQKLIVPLLTEGVGVSSVSSPAESGITADTGAAGGDSFAGAEAVVVRDYEAILTQVDALVIEVDIRPLQVHIEAMILSVTLDEKDEYGVNWQFLRDRGNVKLGLGDPAQTLADFKFEKGALKVGFLDSSLGAFLSALETIGDTNVIASPRLLVLNKQRANIQIGDQKGYISTTVTETVATETVEFLETGTILRIRPFISTDGMIRMEIHPELSKGDVKEKGNFTLPEKQVTEVTTNVMVRDGSTVLIGGLMRDEVATTKNQLPFFGNLPLVGFAFRSSSESTERQEVLVLITPHIVYEPDMGREGSHAAAEFHRRHAVAVEKLEPFNRRHVAQRYYRLAQGAWANGDRKTALRFAEMAVHFLPSYRAAIDLRSDIWLGRPYGDHTLLDPPPMTAEPNPLDGPHIAGWLLDDLRQAPEAVPLPPAGPLHPLEPGTPGPHKDISAPRKMP